MEIPRLDKSQLSLGSIDDHSEDKEYWQGQSAHARLRAIETLRRLNYGERATSARLQRLLTVAEPEVLIQSIFVEDNKFIPSAAGELIDALSNALLAVLSVTVTDARPEGRLVAVWLVSPFDH